jgi:hypothetical protein
MPLEPGSNCGSPNQEPIHSITPQANTDQERGQPPVDPPLGPDVKLTPEHQQDSKHCRPDQTPIGKYILEVLAAGILAVYTVAAIQQLGVMRGQLGEIVKQYPELQKSAGAARDAVTLARDSMHLDQRAWLAATVAEPVAIPEQRGRVTAILVLQNTGKTPALALKGWARLQDIWSVGQEKPEFFKHDSSNDTPIDMPVLIPNALARLSLHGQTNQFGFEKDNFYVNGEVRYCDVFNEAHFVNFCFQWRGNWNPEGIAQYSRCDTAPASRNMIDDINTHTKCR